jgi:hypothetical protein
MTVRLRGKLPAEELNGLGTQRIEEALVREPRSKRIVVAVVSVYERRDHGDGVFEPTVELEHVELLEGKLRDRGVKLLEAGHTARTGSRTLFSTEEEDAEADANLPVTHPPVAGPRFLFEPGAESKWWLVYRAEDGALLARRGPIGVRADLTLGRTYTLDEIDALGDEDLSVLARQLEEEADRDSTFEEAAPTVAGAEDDQRSQYVGPDGTDEASAYGGEPDENEDGDQPPVIPGPIFSDRAKETTNA